MSMITNFFVVPDVLTQQVEKGEISIIDLAQYVQETYELNGEIDKKNLDNDFSHFKEPLELYYRPFFNILEKFYELAFNNENEIPIIGRHPFTDEEVEILTNEYVTYFGGFLTFEDINHINNKLSNLSFDAFLENVFGKNHTKRKEICELIEEEVSYTEEEIVEEMPFLKECYDEFVSYLQQLVNVKGKEKPGLFISID